MENKYEMVVVFDSGSEDSEIGPKISKVDDFLKNKNVQIESIDKWGRRKLAYEIKNKEFGFYVIFTLVGDGAAFITPLEKQLKIDEDVLRHLIVIKDKYSPDLSDDARVATFNSEEEFDEESGDLLDAMV